MIFPKITASMMPIFPFIHLCARAGCFAAGSESMIPDGNDDHVPGMYYIKFILERRSRMRGAQI